MSGNTISYKKGFCAQCVSLCPIICQVENGRLTRIIADKEHPNANDLCPKGLAGPELVYNSQRLRHPMRRTNPKDDPDPGWQPITWEEALDSIAGKLKDIKEQFGPECVAFSRPGVGSSPASLFDDYVSRLAYAFGTPNTLSTTHICQWNRDSGSKYTYGLQPTAKPEFKNTRCIVLWGHNPYATARDYVREIRNALRRGVKLVVVDPRRTEAADRAHLWLQPRPGTDGSLILGMLNVIINEDLFDKEFVTKWTNAPFLVRRDTGKLLDTADVSGKFSPGNYVVWDPVENNPQAYRIDTRNYGKADIIPTLFGSCSIRMVGEVIECDTVLQLLKELVDDYPPAKVSSITGVPYENIIEAARILFSNKPVSYSIHNGLEQHTNSVQTNRALSILYSLTGNYDSVGGNVIYPLIPNNPVRGMELITAEMKRKILGIQKFPLGPPGLPGSVHSYELFNAIMTGKPYPIKAVVAFGSNIVMDGCQGLNALKALRSLDFFAQVELFLTPSANLADIVLPASTFFESPTFRLNFPFSLENRRHIQHVQYRPPVISPLHNSRPDMEIIFQLAKKLGVGKYFWNGNIDSAFNYQMEPLGLTLQELEKHPGGISYNFPTEYKKYERINPVTGSVQGFPTPSGRIEIFSQQFKDHGYDALPNYVEPAMSPVSRRELAKEYPLIFSCRKLLQYCHGQHRSIPSLRKAVPHPFLEINQENASELSINQGDWVLVESPYGKARLKAIITDRVAYGVVFSQHGWWQPCPELNLPGYNPYTDEGSNINNLVPTVEVDPVDGSIPYKSYLCRVSKLAT